MNLDHAQAGPDPAGSRQPLRGYLLRDYNHALVVLDTSRTSQGIGLRELARKTECTESTLSRDFRGIHRIAAFTLFQVAAALGYDLALIPREDRRS